MLSRISASFFESSLAIGFEAPNVVAASDAMSDKSECFEYRLDYFRFVFLPRPMFVSLFFKKTDDFGKSAELSHCIRGCGQAPLCWIDP